MRKFLGTVALALIIVVVVGGLRSWFTIKKTREGDSTEVQVLIDHEKIRSDTQAARDVARELSDNFGRESSNGEP